ncbi:hypothetical protein [Streptomyces sparsogenes]|nr:hypothetical protein [Streptomyces sparsogenes]
MNLRITPPAPSRKNRDRYDWPIRQVRPLPRPVAPRPPRGRKGR